MVLVDQARDAARKKRAAKELQSRQNNQYTVGLVKGRLNPLPGSWTYPKMNIQQMIGVWLMGIPNKRVPPLKICIPLDVAHFDKQSRKLNIMKNCMSVIEKLGRLKGVWVVIWDGATVTRLWNEVAPDIISHLNTVTVVDGLPDSTHKSRGFTRSWRTCADKIIKANNSGAFGRVDNR
jgi:hypothetical protein